jgi:hypothetical protein
VRGFALSDDEALAVLTEWNSRCEPPWSEREPRDKINRARGYGKEQNGGLYGAREGSVLINGPPRVGQHAEQRCLMGFGCLRNRVVARDQGCWRRESAQLDQMTISFHASLTMFVRAR